MTANALPEINRLQQYHLQNATQFDSHNSALRYVCLILTTLPYIMSALSGVFTPEAENATVLATLIRMIKLIWSKNNKYNNDQQCW